MRLSSRQIVALDIQDKYVKCVQMRYSAHSCSIQQTATKEIPHPDDNTSSHYTNTALAIKAILQEMGIYPPGKLVTCISGRDVAIRLLSLPPVDNKHMKNMEDLVRYELMDHLPINVEKMVYDYQILERTTDSTIVLTVSVKRSVLDRHLKLMSLAGISPDVVTASPLTLLNAFVQRELEAVTIGRVGLVCLRGSSGDVVICQDGTLVYTRSFAFANSKEQLIREIHSSFDTYSMSISSENANIEKVYLMTEGDELPLSLAVGELSESAPKASWHISPMADDLTSGLALAGVDSHPKSVSRSFIKLNLRKQIAQEERVDRKKDMRSWLIQMAPAMAIPVLIAIAGTLWWQVHETGERIHALRSVHEQSKQKKGSIGQLATLEKEFQKRVAFLDWSTEAYPMVSYRLYQIAQTIPDSLWLKAVYIPERNVRRRRKDSVPQAISKLYVVGYAHKQEQIDEFLTVLRQQDCFSDVKQESTTEVRVTGERVLEFQIGLTSHADKMETQLAKVEISK